MIKVDDRALRRALARLVDRVEARATRAAEVGAEVVADEARRLVPVDTGELRSSIHVETGTDEAAVVADADHAIPVEFAVRGGQPFMRPAADASHREVTRAVAKEMKEALR